MKRIAATVAALGCAALLFAAGTVAPLGSYTGVTDTIGLKAIDKPLTSA